MSKPTLEVNLKTYPYTMTFSQPKTGSSTVMSAVSSVGIPIHRCYVGNINDYHIQDMPTITMVREPITRYLSWLWEQHLNKLIDHPSTIQQSFMMQQIEQGLSWFEDHYRQTTGINIYGNQFVKKNGYKITSIRSLVILTDRLSDVLEKALLEFLPPYFPNADYDNIVTEHRAKGTDRFGSGYAEYLKTVKFPREFLVKVYNHRFCKHFFYEKDRKASLSRWER